MDLIYFDNSATTKPCEASLSKMREALCESWGNPSSVHRAGDAAHKLMEAARAQISASLGIRRPADGSVIFTSGGSEANNLAMLGSIRAKARPEKGGSRGKVFITDGEHSSVEATAVSLEAEGYEILRIPTLGGRLDLDFLRKNADSTTVLFAGMLVNNETGAIYDIKSASAIVKNASPKAFVHCDAVQGYMKIPFTLKALGVDSIAVSAHKIYAPKGAGALAVTAEVIKGKRLIPLIYGGGQEGNLRSGTENIPAIAAFGTAAEEGMKNFSCRAKVLAELKKHALELLSPVVKINAPVQSADHIINITLPQIKSETMLNFLSGQGICVSAGSTCSTHSKGVSRALTAFGVSASDADSSIRISFSHNNTTEEIESFVKALKQGIATLARISK